MKPSIPDTGTIIRLEGEDAVVRMNHEGSCRKCGAAAIGLCKAGQLQVLTVRNTAGARVGAVVKIGLAQKVQCRGYFLAYVVPPAALVFGAVAGHLFGDRAGLPQAQAEIAAGFIAMAAASFTSLRRLKRLASSHSIEIVQVLSDPRNTGSPQSDEETTADWYAAYF